MSAVDSSEEAVAITSNERATPSLVYRVLLRSIRDGSLVPGAKIPNERDLALQLKTSRTAVRSALAMMERQGMVRRQVGAGTFLTEDARTVFDRMDQTNIGTHKEVPSFVEITESRLLFEPAMMDLVVSRAEDHDIEAMYRTLQEIRDAPTWHEFKERIYGLNHQIYAATRNRFLTQVMDTVLADRRAVAFDGRNSDKPAPDAVREQTFKELSAIVDAVAARDSRRASELTSDYLMRMLATINIWQ